MLWDGISSVPDITVNTAVTRSSLPRLWERGIAREGEDDWCVGEATALRISTKMQMEPGETNEETSECVRSEWVNKRAKTVITR